MIVATLVLVGVWVAGPNLHRVPVGPDELPGWMGTVLMSGQILATLGAAGCVYGFVIRPWRRQREISIDGLLCLAAAFASVYDPISNALQSWFTYNSYLWNWGSPVSELPFVISMPAPALQPAWSVPFIPAGYICSIPLFAILGSAVMRTASRRFPRLGGVGLTAVCVVFMLGTELILEAVLFLPLGFFSYPGGSWPITFGGHYFALPFNEWLHGALFFTVGAVLRYFTDDRGETLVERGLHRCQWGPYRRTAARLAAVTAFLTAGLFVVYHIPQAVIWAPNAPDYPDDVLERSYFLNQCGSRVDRACPGPAVPLSRPGSGHVDWSGNFIPPGTGGD